MKRSILFLLSLALCAGAGAKLPPPALEAQAKAELTKAENAHKDKVDGYKSCLAQNAVAKRYLAGTAARGKTVTATPPCADPGPFVPPPMAATPAAPVAAAPAAAAKK